MIFVRDKGQMCNNILQYGHLYAWGREHGRATVSMRFAYKYPFFAISESRHHNFAMYLAGKWGAGLGLLPVVDFEAGCDPDSVAVQLETHRHTNGKLLFQLNFDVTFDNAEAFLEARSIKTMQEVTHIFFDIIFKFHKMQ